MSIEIKSYVKSDHHFHPVETFSDPVDDVGYLEGAIQLKVDGVELMGLKQWDYVTVLWAYLLDGAEHLLDGQDFHTYFPDQPISLNMNCVSNELAQVEVSFGETRSKRVRLRTFCTSLVQAAEMFLDAVEPLCSSGSLVNERKLVTRLRTKLSKQT